MDIIKSTYQNQKWRQEKLGKLKSNTCEIYQRDLVEKITGIKCQLSKGTRINKRTGEMKMLKNPMSNKKKCIPNGFDWSEDFDGYQEINDTKLYYNFKFVVGNGGNQTRTLKLVYSFIESQLDQLLINDNVIFLNILDGDFSFDKLGHFLYLINMEKYKQIKHRCFIGDMYDFQSWFSKMFSETSK